MGEQPHEACRHEPRNTDSLGSVHQVLPPAASRLVQRRAGAVGVDEQVQVRDDHCGGEPAKSPASIESLSWFSRNGSTPGLNPLSWGVTW